MLTEQKIGEGVGEFQGSLTTLDAFGAAVTDLGDLDGDGIIDVIVGAPRELAAVRPGKAWILFLKEDGTVRDEVEVVPDIGVLGSTDQFGSSVATIGNLAGMAGTREIVVGASGTPGGGAVWILSLDAAGAVVDERSLVGTGVSSGDQFGSSVAVLGDLDTDGVPDIAVGARLANDGGVDAGAVWVLLLNANGTIKAQTRISDLVGGFTAAGGNLDAQDNFGAGLSSPGDVDGDGLEDLFVGTSGDDGTGAVWVLYLNASGTVKATHKIAAVAGVDAGDRFGASVAALGNLDASGGIELAVGAPRDDDGVTDRGAAWILFLDATEMVSSSLKISDTMGAFTGDLNGGLFGASVASLGDLDQDGRIELAVGESAAFAPMAGVGTGAVWILSLVGPTDSVWTGALSTDWFDAGNWSLGLPSATTAAVVRQAANAPVVAANGMADAECRDLALGKFASLNLASATEPLEVHRNLRASGTASGSGDLLFSGDGSVLATLPITAPVVVAATGTVELRGTLALNAGLDLASGSLEVCEDCRTTVVGSADFGVGLLGGAGLLDLDADATFVGTDVSTPPTIHFSGDVAVDGAFAPQSGLMVFDGAAPQALTETSASIMANFHAVTVMPSADVAVGEGMHVGGHLALDGRLALNEPLVVMEGMSGSSGSAELLAASTTGSCTVVEGDWGPFNGLISRQCMYELRNPSQPLVVLDVPQGFPGDLLINADPASDVVLMSSSLSVAQNLKILSGTLRPAVDASITAMAVVVEQPGRLDATSRDLGLTGGTPVTVRGELAAGPGGALLLDASPVSIESGGLLELNGAPGDRARVGKLTTGRYALTVQDGASLDANEFAFETMASAGVRVIDLTGGGTVAMTSGSFDEVAQGMGGGVLLQISLSQPGGFEQITFGDTGIDVNNLPPDTYNVRVPMGSALIGFSNWTGAFSGPAFDDPDEFAVWGATLIEFLVVKEGQTKNLLRWRTSAETDVVAYLLDRAELPAGVFGTPVLVPATGPGLYTFTDAPIVPGQPYRYRLSERLMSGTMTVDSKLAVRDTDGSASPGRLPRSQPPAPLPLVTSSGRGTVDGLLDALSVRSYAPRLIDWQLIGGRAKAFELPTGDWLGLDLSPASDDPFVLDASDGPLVLRGLRADQGVALAALAVDAGDPGRLALVIEGCEGAVLLDGMDIRGRVFVSGSTHVLVQASTVSALELWTGAHLEVRGGQLGAAELEGRSRLESAAANWLTKPRVASGSSWHDGVLAPALAVHPLDGGLAIDIAGEPIQTWVLAASNRLTDVLGPGRGGVTFPLGRSAGDGFVSRELDLPEGLRDARLYLRAEPFGGPLRGERAHSNAVRFRASR